MDWEFEDPTPRYRLCQAGFGLIALAIGLLCADAALDLAWLFTGHRGILALTHDRLWTWLVGAPITWGSLIGSYLLWGRWSEPRWQRRAGLLVLMNTIDLVLWFLNHGDELGLWIGEVPHRWLRGNLAMGLGWAELGLMAGLAADVSDHLGKGPETIAGGTVAKSFAGVGAAIWALWFLGMTDWGRWPLGHRWLTPPLYLLLVGSTLVLTLTTFQVAALSILASRHCGEFVRELKGNDPMLELLRSRSEQESDDFWEAPRPDPWR
ncbi:MAG: hypothetical protein IRY99_08275 [Isosphaeraceae bacterium]|nr:hypothetical protein [Isosphaeraceae bacterium]